MAESALDRYTALTHAVKAHAGELDKCGRAAILHPIAVAAAVDDVNRTIASTENNVVVALLHDVWEDTDYNDHNYTLSSAQAAALEAITRGENERYFDYIARCAAVSHEGGVVKLADLWHNLQPERQNCLPAGERRSLEKRYLKARQIIWDALCFEWWPT